MIIRDAESLKKLTQWGAKNVRVNVAMAGLQKYGTAETVLAQHFDLVYQDGDEGPHQHDHRDDLDVARRQIAGFRDELRRAEAGVFRLERDASYRRDKLSVLACRRRLNHRRGRVAR